MAYYPSPDQGNNYSVAYHPNPNQGQIGFNAYGNMPPGDYNRPAPFPTDQFGPPSGYSSGPQQYPPPQQYQPPGQSYGYGQPSYGPPIMSQPGAQLGGDWMIMPQGPPNCPPGLEYLMSLSNLFVKQKVEFLEALTGFETQNKFTIKNDRGEKFYWAVEDSNICARNFLGGLRPFDMRIMDSYQNEVMRFSRLMRCDSCCFPCCLQKMEVSAPPGNLIGTVEQEWSLLSPKFSVKDANGETVLRIEGPFCSVAFCGQAEFQILSRDGEVQVGKISKEWSGFARELFTDADYFGISFPLDLDVRMKAVMLGALFLIDAMYYERHN